MQACQRRLLTFLYAFLPALLLSALPAMSHAVEEPGYQVIRKIEPIELRRYAPYVVAEVVLNSTPESAGNQAFPILAGYIFGKNKGERKLPMTAPVIQTAAPVIQTAAPGIQSAAPGIQSAAPGAQTAAPMRLEMTAPVTQSTVPGGTLVQFVLPKDITLATAPEPIDERVRLREVPATTWAVIRYSGSWSPSNYEDHLTQLKSLLEAAGVATRGEPVLARYDPPFMPSFLRRNEIWLEVR
jgi:SOUL heme-binding protein